VKTVENETKLLQNHVIELTEKVQTCLTKNRSKRHLPNQPVPQTEVSVESKQEGSYENHEIEMNDSDYNNMDDNASIQSEDITNMLRRVMGGDDGEQEDCIMNEIVIDVGQDMFNVETCVQIEEIEDTSEPEETTEPEEFITIEAKVDDPKSILMKKTNEELKSMLKENSLPTKGSKSELVGRLLNNV
jgi:hypothetical protein